MTRHNLHCLHYYYYYFYFNLFSILYWYRSIGCQYYRYPYYNNKPVKIQRWEGLFWELRVKGLIFMSFRWYLLLENTSTSEFCFKQFSAWRSYRDLIDLVDTPPFLQGRQLLWLAVCLTVHQAHSEKGSSLSGKQLLPLEAIFSLKSSFFSEGSKQF